MKIGRNAPCPCGSGRKYKQCCLAKAGTKTLRQKLTGMLIGGVAVVVLVTAVVTLAKSFREGIGPQRQLVWSEAHQHYH